LSNLPCALIEFLKPCKCVNPKIFGEITNEEQVGSLDLDFFKNRSKEITLSKFG
jgi:hypothetical protein